MTAFALKLIALACMILDHLAAVFPEVFPYGLRVIGRVSFPLYAYLIAEGCRHTRSLPGYIKRLALFALISQIPYCLAFSSAYLGQLRFTFLEFNNVFYTLALSALAAWGFNRLRDARTPEGAGTSAYPQSIPQHGTETAGDGQTERAPGASRRFKGTVLRAAWVAVAAGCAAAAGLLDTDYGALGVLIIAAVYLAPTKRWRVGALAFGCLALYGAPALYAVRAFFGGTVLLSGSALMGMAMFAASLAAVGLAALYNGRRGAEPAGDTRGRPLLRWFFYAAYPAHLLILGLIRLTV